MSRAFECDICLALIGRAQGVDCIALDVHLTTDEEGACVSWSNVDLCPECTAKVLAIIRPALQGFDKPDNEPSAGQEGKE